MDRMVKDQGVLREAVEMDANAYRYDLLGKTQHQAKGLHDLYAESSDYLSKVPSPGSSRRCHTAAWQYLDFRPSTIRGLSNPMVASDLTLDSSECRRADSYPMTSNQCRGVSHWAFGLTPRAVRFRPSTSGR